MESGAAINACRGRENVVQGKPAKRCNIVRRRQQIKLLLENMTQGKRAKHRNLVSWNVARS